MKAATAGWPERLKDCVEAECGHFERHYNKLAQKLGVLFDSASRLNCTCHRTYGKTS